MTIVTTGDITIADLNDGLNAFLTQDACLIATNPDGSGGNYAIANTTMVIRQGTVDVSSQWTVTAAPGAGVTGSLSVRTYSVSAMSVDTGFVDLTAAKQGETPITLRFTISKAKQGVVGDRGTITSARAISGTVWSDTEAAAAIAEAGGGSPARGDVVTLHNSAAGWSQTRVRTTGGTWALLAAFFGGDVLVDGTVVATKLAVDSVTANKIAAGAVQAVHLQAGSVTTSKLSVTDFTNLVPDPGFSEYGTTWSSHNSGTIIDAPSADWAGPKVLRVQSNLVFRGFTSAAFAVNPGDPLLFWFQAQMVNGTGNLQGQVQFSADTTFSTIISTTSINISSTSVASNSVMITAAPANARYARIRYTHPATAVESLFGMPLVRRAANGELIVDGSIVANKIAAGAVNAAKIEAGSILASKVAIGDTTNVFPDYDMRDTAFYSSDGPALTLVAVTDPVSGANELRLASIGEAWSGWCNIEPSSHIRARAVTRNVAANAQRIGTVFIEFGTVGVGGVVAPTRRVQILQQSNATSHVAAQIDETLTASENRFRFVLVRSGTDTGSFVTMSGLRVRKRVAGELIVDGSITADKVGANEVIANTANIRDAIITNAKINDLSAAKLIAGTALASTITVNGTTLDLVETRAADPAARVNLGTTQIDPGKILISGATSLADWRRGGDQTKIDGGAISANTIDANKLTVGNRGITVTNVTFDYTPGTNQVTWTSGQVRWVNDAGTATTTNINAGSATWSTGVLYIYFDKTSTLKTTTAIGTAFGTNAAILATYAGGNNLVTDYGKTVIDGASIKTGTITADKLVAGQIITDSMIVAGAVSRRSLIYRPSLLVTTTYEQAVLNTVFTPAPYEYYGPQLSAINNPCMLDYSGIVRVTSNTAGTLQLMMEGRGGVGRSSTTWVTLFADMNLLSWPANWNNYYLPFRYHLLDLDGTFRFIVDGDFFNPGPHTDVPFNQIKLSLKVSAGSCTIQTGASFMLSQISR